MQEIEDSEDTGSEDMEDAEYMEESSDEEWDADDEQVASFTARQFFLQLTNSLPRRSHPPRSYSLLPCTWPRKLLPLRYERKSIIIDKISGGCR